MRGDIINLLVTELKHGGFAITVDGDYNAYRVYACDIIVVHRRSFFGWFDNYIGEVIVHENKCILYKHTIYQTCTVDFADLDVDMVIRFFK